VDGTPFGRYRLVELLGRGGMGEVWRAYDTVTDRIEAIKLLPANFSENVEFQERFRREAHAAARLNTPHVIPIYDYGEIEGRLFVSMRLIDGRDLQTVLADGPLEPSRAVRIIEQVAKALHAAHEVGLLHRDVKPSNILLDRDDFAYLIDFGIARAADQTRLTQSGSAIGTFAYIAPERLDARANEDARADIYSLACVLYECLTGHPPFEADTMPQVIAAHLHAPPPRPSTTQPNVPALIDQVIATGMAKDPHNRYATTIELAHAARDAITAPITRPAAAPAFEPPTVVVPAPPIRSATGPSDPRLAMTPRGPVGPAAHPIASERAAQPVIGYPYPSPPPVAAKLPWFRPLGRRGKLALIAAAVVLVVAAVAAAVGIPALVGHRPSERSYAAQVVLPFTGVIGSVAVDSAGTLYGTDGINRRVLKLPAGSSTPDVLRISGLGSPSAVAVDSAGTLYVAELGNRVLKLPAGSSTPDELPFTGLGVPMAVAVDSDRTVYVTDFLNHRVLKLPAGSATQTVLPFTGLDSPVGVAVDSAATVYVVDGINNRVLKLPAGSATQTVLPFTGLDVPQGVAVDSAGTVYVVDGGKDRVLKLAASSPTQDVLPFTGLKGPADVAVDSAGNVYVTETRNDRVLKLPVQ
jgi:serine/threonine protein kinase, bacterial